MFTEQFAFPCSMPMPEGGTFNTPGMSLRDYFAAHALTGAFHSFTGSGWHNPNEFQIKCFVSAAYKAADAMLLARATGGSDE